MPTLPLSVLIVDDSVDNLEILAMLLRLNGHEVRTAPTALEAVVHLTEWGPDVVLLDLGMPGTDGFTMAEHIRAQSKGVSFLAAVTGHGDAETKAKARAAGFDHHFLKGDDPQELLEMLRSHAARIGRSHK